MSQRPADGLDGFGVAARRAIAEAAAAAGALGTTRVGTEHLLLGVLAVESCAGAAALGAAGVSAAAVRRKVAETHVGGGSPTSAGGAVERSPRADRALSRAHRFAHDRRSPEARSEHLLLGVLDVEGTAGQVLRGLDVDVDALRARLQQTDLARPDADDADGADRPEPTATTDAPLRCGACDSELGDGALVVHRRRVGPDDVRIIACATCGVAIGVGPA